MSTEQIHSTFPEIDKEDKGEIIDRIRESHLQGKRRKTKNTKEKKSQRWREIIEQSRK